MAWPAEVVIPNNRIEIITSLYPGLVKALHVAEGDQVAAGDKLADIASPAFLEAQQDYLDAVAALDMERKNFARDKMLLEEGIISEKTLSGGESLLKSGGERFCPPEAVVVLCWDGLWPGGGPG